MNPETIPQPPSVAPSNPVPLPPNPVVQPQTFPSAKKRSLKPLLYVLAVLVIVAISTGSVYSWQHNQVVDLQSKLKNALGSDADTSSDSADDFSLPVYGGIQQKARNSKRQTDIAVLQTQLEAFYNQNGYYPSFANLNSASWRATNMKSLDPYALIDPSARDQTNGILVMKPTASAYAYEVASASGASCEADTTQCATYTLVATFEGEVNGETTYTKENLD